MTLEYKKLLHLTYEIEGLLMVQMDRPERHSAELDNLIAEKIAHLYSIIDISTIQSAHQDEIKEEEIAETALAEETGDADLEAPVSLQPESRPDPEVITDPEVVVEDEPAPEPAPESEMTDQPSTIVQGETLDEKIAREKAKDIFKAFTLNDKFRFRRELFRNSQTEFDDTLEVIAAMSSIDEAKEYFYEDLCWDPESEDVKDFMAILEKHF